MGLTPEVAVAVPSHDRPLRLRWLLNALEEQTLSRDRFEVVVAHDSPGPRPSGSCASICSRAPAYRELR